MIVLGVSAKDEGARLGVEKFPPTISGSTLPVRPYDGPGRWSSPMSMCGAPYGDRTNEDHYVCSFREGKTGVFTPLSSLTHSLFVGGSGFLGSGTKGEVSRLSGLWVNDKRRLRSTV